MSGTKTGGQQARDTNLANDPDFYRKIGAIGGKNGNTGGFANGEKGRELARRAGRLGGLKSRRNNVQNKPPEK